MKKSRIVMNHLFQLVLGSFIIYITASCAGGIQTPPIDEFHSFSHCTYEVLNCPKKSEPLDVNITGNPMFQINKYQKTYELWGDKSQTYLLYWDSNYTIRNIELPEIKGSLLIRTGYYDSNVDLYDFLKITVLNDIENFYIAYDSRLKNKPNWLTSKYNRMLHPNTSAPYYIIVPTSKPYGDLRLEIWQRNSVPKQGDVVEIPGNIFGCSGCSGREPNMYVVIIKPKVKPDCGNAYVSFTEKIDGCFDTLAAADDMGKIDCLKKYPTLQYGGISCDSVAPCPKEHALKVETRSYPYNSEIEFDPSKYTSIADIEINGNQFYNQKVKGNLDFEYQYQTNNMKLNSMVLKIDPLNTDMGRFQDVTMTLWKSTNAKCKDAMPIYHQPCTHYEIAQGDFVVGLSAKLNEKGLLFAGTNQNVMPITINHQTKTFNFQGPLQTVVKVDGKDTPLNISVNLTGHFVNFAPKAFGQESTRHVECGISSIGNKMKSANKDPVKLDSAGSFEIYDAFLTNPPIYEWYEDFGLVTEKLWGNGSIYTIAPYNLGFGVHNITLVVKDKNGIVDTDTFDVEVCDTIPPELTTPKDITVYQLATEKEPVKVKVDIGQAQAYDTCAEKVMISNDAPKDLLFSPGDTIVTWTADDGHGNLTKKVQKVSVILLEELKDLIWKSSLQIAETTNKSMNEIKECKANPECMINIEPLITALEYFISHVKNVSVKEDKEALRQRVVHILEPALTAIKEADDLSKRSNQMGKEGRTKLRNSALDKLQNARKLMTEV
jgi:hypothetical protein